jgi:hypothetical protein
VTPPAPDPGDAPKRFIRDWLTFNESRPVRMRTLWKLLATVALFLIASALLALFGGHLRQ